VKLPPATLTTGEESAKTRPLLVRVATGISEHKLCSAIWRIWQGDNNDDVYIAPRAIAGAVKCSLHPNRYCYVGFPRPFVKRLLQEGHDVSRGREWTSWERPFTPENDFLFAADIWLPPAPAYELDQPFPKPTWLIEPPQIGKAMVISVVYSRMQKGTPIIPSDVRELGYSRLGSGEYVAVFARRLDFDYEEFVRQRLPEIQANFARRPQFLVDKQTTLESQGLRIFLINDPKVDGRLMVLDSAVKWTAGEPSVAAEA
jgi:hypothetical protein